MPINRPFDSETDPLLTVRDLAQYLNVRDRWVYDAVQARRIPFIKVGHHVRFERAAIEAWLEANERAAR